MTGRRPRLPMEALLFTDEPATTRGNEHQAYADKLQRTLVEAMKEAQEAQAKAAERTKEARDRGRVGKEFEPGEMILLWEPHRCQDRKQAHKKLTMRSTGPHKVLRKVTPSTYIVAHRDRRQEVLADIKDIRIYHPFVKYEENTQFSSDKGIQPGDL